MNWFKFVIAIIICQLAGVVGSIFTSKSVNTWYTTLQKPSLTPPGNVIGIVWIVLFVLMGISLYVVWDKFPKNKKSKSALFTFGVQLVLNILWSVFFFGMKSPFLALINIGLLWLFILLTILSFYKISKISAYLLVPYIVWVSFASYLNFSIWRLN
ncbi:MAG: TspO/MBR family protein [Candidatus Pacearchaeota archaeon]